MSILSILSQMVAALWLMLPAYIPNPAAVIFKGKIPMDFGKNFVDDRRILGKGKTWRGFLGGSFVGLIFGIFQNFLSIYLPQQWFPYFSEDFILSLFIIFTLSFGAMLGDSIGSFIKRRIGIGSGGKAFLLDQLTFVVVAWLLLYIFFPLWFFNHFWKIVPILTIFIITPLLHRAVNILGYKMGKKNVPW